MALNQKLVTVGTVIIGSGVGSRYLRNGADLYVRHSYKSKIRIVHIGNIFAKAFDWSKMPPKLKMGQSNELLFSAHQPKKQGNFLAVSDYNAAEQEVDRRRNSMLETPILDIFSMVKKIKKYGTGEILITLEGPGDLPEILAEQVIVATGAGSERMLEMPTQYRSSTIYRGFNETTTAIKTLTGESTMIFGATIVIFGDGPTALWTAEYYMNAGNSVYVVGPATDRAFKAANPGGRNSHILKRLVEEGRLLTGSIEGLTQLDTIKDPGDASEPGQCLHLHDCTVLGAGRTYRSLVVPNAQIVFSVGSMPDTLSIFDATTRADFAPLTMSGISEASYAFALANQDRDIMVIGAAAVDASGALGAQSLFSAAGNRLYQPDKGIIATRHAADLALWELEAFKMGGERAVLAEMYHQLKSPLFFDPYSANSLQIAQYLQSRSVPLNPAQEISRQILLRRDKVISKGKVYTNEEFAKDVQDISNKM